MSKAKSLPATFRPSHPASRACSSARPSRFTARGYSARTYKKPTDAPIA